MAKKRKENKLSKRKIYFLILGIIIAVFIILIFVMIPKNCGKEKDCFNEKAKICKSTKVNLLLEGGLYEYRINGKKGEECIATVHLVKTSDSIQPDKKEKLENKKMNCKIPLELLKTKELAEWKELSEYCSGELKEAILEISLEKLYGVVVSNIGEVSMGFKDALETTNETS